MLESDQLNSNNVDDGNKLNKLKSDQSDLESDQSDLGSDQSNTTNTGNESKGKTGRTIESKQHPRKDNRNWSRINRTWSRINLTQPMQGMNQKVRRDARQNQNSIHVRTIGIGESHPLNQIVAHQFHLIKLNGQR